MKKIIRDFFKWLYENRKWLFSGIGVTLFLLTFSGLWWLFNSTENRQGGDQRPIKQVGKSNEESEENRLEEGDTEPPSSEEEGDGPLPPPQNELPLLLISYNNPRLKLLATEIGALFSDNNKAKVTFELSTELRGMSKVPMYQIDFFYKDATRKDLADEFWHSITDRWPEAKKRNRPGLSTDFQISLR